LGYRHTPKTGNPANVAGLQFITGLEAARRYVPEMIKQVDLVVVLSHEGTKVDELIAQQVPGIQLIIGAHSHDLISPPKKINQTYLVQALSDAAVLGETEVILENKKIQSVQVQYHKLWHDQWSPDPQIQQEIKKLEAPYQKMLAEKMGDNPALLGRQYKSESPFDKWVGNLMIAATKSQVALLPGVGYGISLPPGPVTKAQIYNLLPHPSKLVTLSLTGKQLLEILEQSAQNQKPANPLEAVGGLIQTAGIRYTMDLRQPIGNRISQVSIAGKPLQAGQDYKVVTHSGMVSGIHHYREIGQGKHIRRMETSLTAFVIARLQGEKTIKMPVNRGEVKLIKADK
jgi:2',3'-cyclic-nucleotide 2'-phosphodiesterase (5'-nucleotidase family)